MSRVVAVGAVSALGVGEAAFRVPEVGQPATTAIAHDALLAQAGLAKPKMGRAPRDLGVPESPDRATDLLVSALQQTCAQLEQCWPGWRDLRVGVCIGSSSGGMLSAERFFAARDLGEAIDPQQAREAAYFAPYQDALAKLGVAATKHLQVVAACASSTIAIGMGLRWLDRSACDLVLAGGYDGISLLVAAGFEAIRATTATMPQPFRTGRDGMLVGEGAGIIAMTHRSAPAPTRFYVSGFGASTDALHITAPDRTGAGLIRAATRAIEDARCDPIAIGLASAHGTSTPYNDAMEAKAIAAVCPGDPVVHPFKAQIGHTLGAAGVLETLAAADALMRDIAPASYGTGPLDPDARVRLLAASERAQYAHALKLSAAFGGVTAALVLSRAAPQRPATVPRPVAVVDHAAIVDVDRAVLADQTGIARDRLARIDGLGQLGLAALAALVEKTGRARIDGAGVVAGYVLASLDTNDTFNQRILNKGARYVDPRLFPATSPNSGAGHCAIAFGLKGPNFAVCSGTGGPFDALTAAAELIASGDADRMIVIAADESGPASQAWCEAVCPDRSLQRGAVAVLLEVDAGGTQQLDLDMEIDHGQPWVAPVVGSETPRGPAARPPGTDAGALGHRTLVDWLAAGSLAN